MGWTKVVVCLFNTYYTDDLGTKLLFTKSMILWTKVRLVVAEVRGRLLLSLSLVCAAVFGPDAQTKRKAFVGASSFCNRASQKEAFF